KIVITEVERGELHLRHEKGSLGDLDQRYAEKTLGYLYELWKAPVYLETMHGERLIRFINGPNGFKVEK
ncbi:MAG: hypothetical protein M1570_14600, partial [Chloroflexi bacterium]|nr:hypothetical protein [Chloroflexota bacterium]